MIDVEVFNSHPRIRLRKEQFARGVQTVFRESEVKEGEVRVIFVDAAALLRINREFLKHDYHTDVITFDYGERPLDAEIYVSVDQAGIQADEFSVTLHSEALRLVIHGALHLLGYDDQTEADRNAMRLREDRFLRIVEQGEG